MMGQKIREMEVLGGFMSPKCSPKSIRWWTNENQLNKRFLRILSSQGPGYMKKKKSMMFFDFNWNNSGTKMLLKVFILTAASMSFHMDPDRFLYSFSSSS